MTAAIASKLAPTDVRTGMSEGPLWEAADVADWALTQRRALTTAIVGVRRPLPQNPRSGRRSGTSSCRSGLDRDRAIARRRLRSLPQSRASSLPKSSLQALAKGHVGDSGSARGLNAAHCPPPLSGSEDPSYRIVAPATDWARPPVGAALAATRPVHTAGVHCGAPVECAFSTRSLPPAGRTPALRRHALRSATPRRRRAA